MKGKREVLPFLTVLKGDEVVDTISLEGRDVVVMGRHHSCDLVVGHASSSRRHLEIQIIQATRDLIFTDLGSVHGTWVRGSRLNPMTPVVIKNGATFQLAASSRVYRIDWQPALVEYSDSELSASDSVQSSNAESALREMSSHSGSRSGLRHGFENQENKEVSSQIESKSGSIRHISDNQEKKSKVSSHHQSKVERALIQQDENVSPAVLNSPGKRGLQRVASSPKLPMRRLAFSGLQSSGTNVPSPRSPSVKKGLTDRSASARPAPAEKTVPSSKQRAGAVGGTTPSRLWLRRCNSAPLPPLATDAGAAADMENSITRPSAPPLSALIEEEEASRDGSSASHAQYALNNASKPREEAESDEEYRSDKENVDPGKSLHKCMRNSKGSNRVLESYGGATSRDSSLVESIERQPFRPLVTSFDCTAMDYRPVFQSSYASSEEEYGSKALGLPRPRLSSATHNLDQMLRTLKLSDSTEGRKQWHAVIDTNCLLDNDSLNALKQLEGIKETCVIIPKIVVRELDFLKHRDGLRSPARAALKWIESCMLKLPNWIHVQTSSESLPVGVTPPPSPSSRGLPQHGLMSPTNDDHILECALLFDLTVRHGKVALLTRDTALKIKAMAEGLISESATEFCESLLSPYSNRFLWAGSTAHGKTWVESPLGSPVLNVEGESKSKWHAQVNHKLEDLRHHVTAKPRGLHVVLTQ